MSVTIRTYRDDDLETCRRLWVELTAWHRELYDSPSIGGETPGLHFDEHLAAVGADHVLLAELDSEVVGMSGLVVRGTEVELEPLVVDPAARGQGVGVALADAVITRARQLGARTVVVKPAARNMAAIRLFHRRGFDVLGQVELMLDLVPGERIWTEATLGELELRH